MRLRQVRVDLQIQLRGPLLEASEQQVLGGAKSDGPESVGVSDGRVDLGEGEGWNGPSDPRVLISMGGCNGTASRAGNQAGLKS